MPIPILPDAPSRTDPVNFSTKADAWVSALGPWTTAANQLEQSLQMVATTGTSSTSKTISNGTWSLVTQAGKAWVTGAYLYIVSSSNANNLMTAKVTSYNSSTGDLTVNVTGVSGSGTYSDWVIGLSTGIADSMNFVTSVSAPVVKVDNFYKMFLFGTSPVLGFDNDTSYMFYDRTGSTLDTVVNSSTVFRVSPTGPRRFNDATNGDDLVRKSQMDIALVAAQLATVPVGTVFDYAGETPPYGYLECDGSLLNIMGVYNPLYAVIGTLHGGSGSQFRIPDHRGKFKRSWAHGTANDPDRATRTAAAAGGVTGDRVGTLQDGQIQGHNHINGITVFNNGDGVSPYGPAQLPAGATFHAGQAGATTNSSLTSTTGGNQTNPINVYVMSIIKVI